MSNTFAAAGSPLRPLTGPPPGRPDAVPGAAPDVFSGGCPDDDRDRAFDAFARRQIGGLSKLAWLLTGDHATAEDLTAETLLAAWNQWTRILEVGNPTAYLRRIMINMAAARVRSSVRERRRIRLFHADSRDARMDPDGGVVVDVRAALRRLPVRRRACVVLRHAFDLSEDEVARILCVSVGTVKSQTSRGMAQLHGLLSAGGDDDA